MPEKGSRIDIQTTIESLRIDICIAEQGGDWEKAERLNAQYMKLLEKTDIRLIVKAAQLRWDTMTEEEHDIYPTRPKSRRDLRIVTSHTLSGEDRKETL